MTGGHLETQAETPQAEPVGNDSAGVALLTVDFAVLVRRQPVVSRNAEDAKTPLFVAFARPALSSEPRLDSALLCREGPGQ